MKSRIDLELEDITNLKYTQDRFKKEPLWETALSGVGLIIFISIIYFTLWLM